MNPNHLLVRFRRRDVSRGKESPLVREREEREKGEGGETEKEGRGNRMSECLAGTLDGTSRERGRGWIIIRSSGIGHPTFLSDW